MTNEKFGTSQYEQALKLILTAVVPGDKITVKVGTSMDKGTYKSTCKIIDSGITLTTITKDGEAFYREVYDNETNTVLTEGKTKMTKEHNPMEHAIIREYPKVICTCGESFKTMAEWISHCKGGQ